MNNASPAGFASIFRQGLFDGQSAVVTGAGSGIGRCTAHELASLGARVALVGRSLEKLSLVQQEIAEAGGKASCYVLDIREEAAVKRTIAIIREDFGRIDMLVNNAGGQYVAPLSEITGKGWDAVVRTNLTGGFLMARECYVQTMKESVMLGRSASVVNVIADIWRSMPLMGHSGAARAGMLNLTQTAAFEWAPVRVNAVAPGWIASSGLDRYADMRARIRSLPQFVPLRRIGTESEVSGAICFLLSPAASFISGACVRVDGAVPCTDASWPVHNCTPNIPFNGFHLAADPDILK